MSEPQPEPQTPSKIDPTLLEGILNRTNDHKPRYITGAHIEGYRLNGQIFILQQDPSEGFQQVHAFEIVQSSWSTEDNVLYEGFRLQTYTSPDTIKKVLPLVIRDHATHG